MAPDLETFATLSPRRRLLPRRFLLKAPPSKATAVELREAEFFGTKPSGPLNFDVFVEPRTGCPQGDPDDPGSSETNESEKNG